MLSEVSAVATIGVKNLEAAKDFYEKKLGLSPVSSGGPSEEVQMYKSGTTMVELYHSEYAGTNKATALSWVVSDISKEVDELKNQGISFEHYNFPDLKMEGDIHVMGEMRAAWFKDPDGNILSLVNH
jgi:catechol 2,3-dioxygenase-like lactoylglutathione lyase family enzyme